MSYYIVKAPGTVNEAAAGMGAFVRQGRAVRPIRASSNDRVIRAARPTGPWSRPRGFRAVRGFGAFEFNAASVWHDINVCNTAWQTSQTTAPQCNWTDKVRGALGTLGYGQLPMGGSWGSADIAAYKSWCRANGIAEGTYPTQSSLSVMETQLAQHNVTGTETPVEYTESGGSLVPAAAVTKAGPAEQAAAGKGGPNLATMALVAVGLIGLGAIAMVAAKRRGSSTTRVSTVAPVTGPLPATA
jgi:hypothetical protein